MNNDLEEAHPQSGSSSTIPRRIGISKCWFLGGGRREPKNQLNQNNVVDSGIWTQAILVEGGALTTGPVLLLSSLVYLM